MLPRVVELGGWCERLPADQYTLGQIDAGMLGAPEACKIVPVEEAIAPGESIEVERVADPAIAGRADAVRRNATNWHDLQASCLKICAALTRLLNHRRP